MMVDGRSVSRLSHSEADKLSSPKCHPDCTFCRAVERLKGVPCPLPVAPSLLGSEVRL